MTLDADTRAWVRNRGDELAAADGCRFDVDRGSHAVWWIERFCRLYEGEQAGEPLVLRGCHQCHGDPDVPAEWNDETAALYRARADRHCACVAAGHFVDWQYDVVMRLFGWVKQSSRWKREVRRFREASIWVAKKNKKSPTLAAVGLYLHSGDGEPGQKVFLGAKDGKQAREIAGKHVVEMYLANSADFTDEDFSLNQNLMQLTHVPSRSILLPLSSSNTRTKEAKEGINGSVLIDETHVVDEEFIGIISRAGISRSEPLQIEVSTAGNNPDGYGKKRFDLAQQVIAGKVKRHELLAVIYAAPQDLTDEALAADPLRYARLANPALGHTVDPEEFLRDYQNSRPNISEYARFKMYRLDIWQRSSNPWLRDGIWEACAEDFTEEELVGRDCYAGLDLAKTRDTCGLVLLFPMDDGKTFRQLPYYWLPELRARELATDVPFLEWHRDGFIDLTDGDEVDYGVIRHRINELRVRFNIVKIAYDTTYAAQLMQRLVEEDGMDPEIRVPFPQTLMKFAGPTASFERHANARTIRHNGHPVFAWQMGNVKVYQDLTNGNKRPVKHKHGSHQTIDGPVAAIMGLWAAEEFANQYGMPSITIL
jgi:phage terminase large subunit-like protein